MKAPAPDVTITRLTHAQADELAGRRVDRRRRYATDGTQLLEVATWTVACSGCVEVEDYAPMPEAGSGCFECGYSGKRRTSMWVPVGAPGAALAARRVERTRRPPADDEGLGYMQGRGGIK